MKKRKPTKMTRWLESIGACHEARLKFGRCRTFDEAWKRLDRWLWVWWLGEVVLGLSHDRDYDYDRRSSKIKRRIYLRTKIAYTKFQ